ncbi:hypothetical protein BCR44DRAFT_322858 [Catenaria anguillulae PL171]|uniref:Uncharacterized protein n=1 Tax=Catenaria anguillulae PL171 TaxID=765915 RepID=A0A1Y2H5B9_9FUNG|nr:hypothetical protein BCR44DRAFT_322858 [Catenaria anguillulae PL171]
MSYAFPCSSFSRLQAFLRLVSSHDWIRLSSISFRWASSINSLESRKLDSIKIHQHLFGIFYPASIIQVFLRGGHVSTANNSSTGTGTCTCFTTGQHFRHHEPVTISATVILMAVTVVSGIGKSVAMIIPVSRTGGPGFCFHQLSSVTCLYLTRPRTVSGLPIGPYGQRKITALAPRQPPFPAQGERRAFGGKQHIAY